jgi:RES domain-containing protein
MQRTNTTFAGLTFRAGSADDADLIRAARSSRDDPGRFNTTDVGAVYVSRDPVTAMCELQRTVHRSGCSLTDAHPCSLLVIDASLRRMVDLTQPEQMTAWALSQADLVADDMRRCQDVARAAAMQGAEGVMWPSATGAGQSVALFIEHLRLPSAAHTRRVHELTREMLDAIERGEPIARILSALEL